MYVPGINPLAVAVLEVVWVIVATLGVDPTCVHAPVVDVFPKRVAEDAAQSA